MDKNQRTKTFLQSIDIIIFLNLDIGDKPLEDDRFFKIKNMKLEKVKIRRWPRKMKLNSLTIESSHIKEEDKNSSFFYRNEIGSINLVGSDIDSVHHLGLDKLRSSTNSREDLSVE